jgi:hypothetical protein
MLPLFTSSFINISCEPVNTIIQPEHAVTRTRYALVGGVKKTSIDGGTGPRIVFGGVKITPVFVFVCT